MTISQPGANVNLYYPEDTRARMRDRIVSLCSMAFVVALITADVSNIKVFAFHLSALSTVPGLSGLAKQQFLLPAGTLAFSTSFIMTDVICEIAGRSTAVRVVFTGIAMRVLTLIYFNICVGGSSGAFSPLYLPPIWTPEKQAHYAFVLGGTIYIVLASVLSSGVSFLNDLYFFNYLRARHRERNLFWFRNFLATALSQIINSLIFISFAYGFSLTMSQVSTAVLGQLIFKVTFAAFDAPFAYALKNAGQGRRGWYKIWSVNFWRG